MQNNINLQQIYILSILSKKDCYGLELIKIAKDKCQYTFLPGSLYTFLSKLKNKELVQPYLNEDKTGVSGPVRKYYKITEMGRQELKKHQTIFKNIWTTK